MGMHCFSAALPPQCEVPPDESEPSSVDGISNTISVSLFQLLVFTGVHNDRSGRRGKEHATTMQKIKNILTIVPLLF